MTKVHRRRLIIRYLRRKTSSSIAELAREMGLNRETLRRDLVQFEEDGLVTRHENRIYLNDTPEQRETLSRYGVLAREERLQEIACLMKARITVRTSWLSQTFRVSSATIRTDLRELQKRGIVRLGHGSAEYTDQHETPFLYSSAGDGSVPPSNSVSVVAARAASHIESGDTIFLDDSLFARSIVDLLHNARDITVVTTSLQVIYMLSRRQYPCQIITLSGALEPGGTALQPLSAQPYFEQNLIHKTFLGLASFSERGDFSLEAPIPSETLGELSNSSDKLFALILSQNVGTGTVDKQAFPIGAIAPKLTEVIVDDQLDNQRAREVFPRHTPVTLCGPDHVYYLHGEQSTKIGFAVYPGHTDFRQEVVEGVESASKQRKNYALHTWHNHGDYESIIDNVNHLLSEKIDLLIDYSSNNDVAVLVAQKANELNVPLIMVDLPVQNAIYFGANNVLAGQIAGERAAAYIARHWHGVVDMILLLEKEVSGSVCKQRVLGSIDALREGVKFTSKDVKHIDCSRGIDYYAHKLQRYLDRLDAGNTCLVISFGEDTTVESHRVIEEYAKDRRIIMVAQNYGHNVKRLMESPTSPLIGCVAYSQEQYGERIMSIVDQILHEQRVDPVNYTEHRWMPNRFHGEEENDEENAPL